MPLTVPNESDSYNALQAALDSRDIDMLVRGGALDGDGLFFDGLVSAQGTPNMSVSVEQGAGRVQQYCTMWATQSIAVTAASSLPRTDLVVYDTNGAIAVLAGTPASHAPMPTLPSSQFPLAAILVTSGITAISASNILDKRVFVPDRFDYQDDFISGMVITSGAAGALGWTRSATGTAADQANDSEINRPGIFRIQTGTASGNSSRIHLGNTASKAVFDARDVTRFRFVCGTTAITFQRTKYGLGQDISVMSGDSWGTCGAWFEINTETSSVVIRCNHRDGGTTTTVSAAGPTWYLANSWYQMDYYRKSNGDGIFSVNKTIVATIAANDPSSFTNFGWCVYTTTGSARSGNVDFAGISLRFDPRTRW